VLERMAKARSLSLAALIVEIDADRQMSLLASACRVRALKWVEAQA
jgi:predicted DNA-binding ribbon-helix-helix protein